MGRQQSFPLMPEVGEAAPAGNTKLTTASVAAARRDAGVSAGDRLEPLALNGHHVAERTPWSFSESWQMSYPQGLVTPFVNPTRAGEQELPGLTDEEKPRLRGPKRASKIRKLFNLTKDDDVRKYVNTYRKVRPRRSSCIL